ncbi:hypothetical protein OG21DRAFT_1488605 [Imleria badia]|nr:hypothetical protein OG21DRAFT_1488605 [Imleria badia]
MDHEYIQWTTISTSPADGVLLYQLHYEAFVDWKTPAVLACIPVHLKVAVALFYAGMVVQLVTLNAVVAGVCAVPVAITLALAIPGTSHLLCGLPPPTTFRPQIEDIFVEVSLIGATPKLLLLEGYAWNYDSLPAMYNEQGNPPAGANVNNSTNWEHREDFYKDLDRKKVDDVNKDMNPLLFFAGSFSVTLIVFLRNTQGRLEQLAAAQMVELSKSPVQSAPFTLTSPSVLMNKIWYLSLVLNLAYVLFGMMVKKRLRTYMQWTTTSTFPTDARILRLQHYNEFVGWKTPAIIAYMPVLLQVAIGLFLLKCFLWRRERCLRRR